MTRFYWSQHDYHVESDLVECVQIRANDWDTRDCIYYGIFLAAPAERQQSF